MVDIDLDIDDAAVRESLRSLRDDWGGDAVYIVVAGVEYAVFLEYGTEDMPPYPFFRPAIREFEANPESFLLENTEFSSLDGIDSADEMVRVVSYALERQMKVNATAEAPGRSAGTHPEHPQVVSGTLRSRIQARRIK